MTPARQKIATHLAQGRTLTPLQALRLYNSLSLSQHVSALKKQGMKIGSYIKPGHKFAVYYCVGNQTS